LPENRLPGGGSFPVSRKTGCHVQGGIRCSGKGAAMGRKLSGTPEKLQ